MYIDLSGLYLLSQEVPTESVVKNVCILGYTRIEIESMYINADGTAAAVRPFVYAILYRPVDVTDPTVYRMISKSAVVYHFTESDCFSSFDGTGLDWQVRVGDRIGIFVPDECIDVEELPTSSLFLPDLEGLDTLCPSQVNLAPNGSAKDGDQLECSGGHYLNVSLQDLAEVRVEDFSLEQTDLNVEVYLGQSKYCVGVSTVLRIFQSPQYHLL